MTRIHWTPVADGLPDAELTVLCAISDEAMGSTWGPHEPVVVGWCDGECWLEHVTGGDITGAVTHWCELPERPA